MIDINVKIQRDKTGFVVMDAMVREDKPNNRIRLVRKSWISDNVSSERDCVFNVSNLIHCAFQQPGRIIRGINKKEGWTDFSIGKNNKSPLTKKGTVKHQ